MVTSTTSPTATSSLVTALGGGSGVDMLDLANKLAQAQFAARNDRLTAKSDTLNTKVSSASNIKSMLLALDTSLGTLVRSGDLSRQPSVANSAVATATLSGTSTPQGSYSLEVTSLAKGQRTVGPAYLAGETVAGGTLTLRFGTITGTTFDEDSTHASVDIDVADGASLADVASAINAKNAGVQAYVAQTVDGAQLVLKGSDGAANAFVLEAAEDPLTPGLSRLAWDPATATDATWPAKATDAAFKIDGLQYSATSNTVTDPVPGVKLKLTAENPGAPTTISFADPTDSIASTMTDLTDALNEVMSELNAATAIGGELANDAGARSLKRALSGLAGTVIMPSATGAARTLADLGLKTQRDGTFALDTARLNATIAADPEGVAAMFTNGVYGVFASVDKIYRDASSTTNSNSLGGSISRYTKQIAQLTEDQTKVAEDQEKLRARLASQFTKSEGRIGVFNATKTMLENQIAQWNKSSN